MSRSLAERGTSVEARLEDTEFMASTGERFGNAARRLHMTRTGLEEFLRDHHRPDLIAALGGAGS